MPCVFLLTGWGKKAVESLNDTPLIDLDKAIKETPIGSQGNTFEFEEMENNDDIVDSQAINSPETEDAIIQVEDEKVLYTIEIRDETIKYNNSICSIDNLESKIKSDCFDGEGKVQLIDDFAEMHVYNEVITILEHLKETIGLEYKYE